MEAVYSLANNLRRCSRQILTKPEMQDLYDDSVSVTSVTSDAELSLLLMQLATLIMLFSTKFAEEDYIDFAALITGYGVFIKDGPR